MESNSYITLAAIDVGDFAKSINGMTYLPWSRAVDQLLRQDGDANWEWLPERRYPKTIIAADGTTTTVETVMVGVSVTAFGKTKTEWLPVMDGRNRAVANPDVCQINNAMRRCLTKAIALHGLGIYIYHGEDLPLAAEEVRDDLIKDMKAARTKADLDDLLDNINAAITDYPVIAETLREAYGARLHEFATGPKVVKAKGVAGLKERLSKEEVTNG